MSGYSVLSTAISGLAAAQRGMDITSQNIVNANTPGYSRQLIKLTAVAPTLVSSVHTAGNPYAVGGVQLEAVVRVRDTFLEATRVSAGSTKAALDAQTSALGGVETLINEPSDASLQSTLDEFYASWQTVADAAGSQTASAAGAVVIQTGVSLASQVNMISAGISGQWDTSRADLKATVSQLNDATTRLAQLNQQIVTSSATTGQPVNELLDTRDLLLRQIGELGGGTASLQPNGTATVTMGGATVVFGNTAVPVSLEGALGITEAETDPPRLVVGGATIQVSAGKAAGLLAAITTDLPNVLTALDGTAIALRDAVNALHENGYTAAGASGGSFFTGDGAFSLRVAITSPAELAYSDAPGAVNGATAQALADLSEDVNARAVLGGPGPSELWRGLASSLGSKIQGLTMAGEVQATILDTADSAVDSNAGVNLDEEMTNLLMYQRAYQAAAKVITAIDEMMDTLINRTGI